MGRKTHTEQELQRHDPTGVERYGGSWSNHRSQHHAHPEYQLTLSVAGTGRFTYLSGEAKMPAGCLSVFHPGEPHLIETNERAAAWRMRVLHIPLHYLEARGRPLVQPAPFVADDTLLAAFGAVWDAVDGSKATMERALVRLAGLLAERPGLEASSRPRSDLVRRCLSHLAGITDRPVSMAELARSCGASATQIRRAIIGATGLPPLAWHLQRRIQESKHLLSRGHSVSDTALATGFADQAHFTRHFSRLVCISPSRYAAGVRGRGAG